MHRCTISHIDPDSPLRHAAHPGDRLVSINGNPITDVLDYKYYAYDPELAVCLRRPDGTEHTVHVSKPLGGELGLDFETYLMDNAHSCANHCVFCFVDQMPKGMRDTLYFKDDDARLSFLMGNYITLTNLSRRELQRICDLHISPINISVHATDPEVRRLLLGNQRRGGECLEHMRTFAQAGIVMNCQIVACPGLNDGAVLQQSMEELAALYPQVKSVSVVPVGLSKYREGLYPLEPFTKEDACEVIDLIEKWQKINYERHGIHFIHASDEWYILAEREMPEEGRYDGYIQLENGVGMLRLLHEEVMDALDEKTDDGKEEELSIATGRLPYPYLDTLVKEIMKVYPGRKVHIYPIRNDFFGEKITVAGLITGQDLIAQLKDKPLGDRLILPAVMFKSGEEIFLDDITKTQAEDALQIPINIVKSSGYDLVDAILDPEAAREQTAEHGAYELTMKDAGLTEDGEVIPDWDGEV